MIKRNLLKAFILLILIVVIMGCVSSRQELFHEQSINRSEIDINRIAIVPNRLPINLTNPEKWRRYNWRVASDYLTRNGYQVADYNTSVQAFDNSGLRLEDTQSSRDKYAELAEKLSVDVLVIPYYGTFASAKTFFLYTVLSWNSVTTFQFYSLEHNDFITRIDASGSSTYIAGLFTSIGLILQIIEAQSDMDTDFALPLITMGAGLLIDMTQTVFRTNDSHWASAFKHSIRRGLKAFVNSYNPLIIQFQ